jgi:hypothetical protein
MRIGYKFGLRVRGIKKVEVKAIVKENEVALSKIRDLK